MKQSKKIVLLVGAIGLVVVFIYGYSNYGLEFGKFFAAEPGPEEGAPLGTPVATPASLPTTVLMNGDNTLANYSIASSPRTWLKRIAFSIDKTPAISLSSLRIFEDGADITSLTTLSTDRGLPSGFSSARVVFTFKQERSLQPGHFYKLKATATGVSSGMSIQTRVLNGSGVGRFQPMTYAGGLENWDPAVSLVWTDKAAKNHSNTTSDWYSDRNVRILPLSSVIWTQ